MTVCASPASPSSPSFCNHVAKPPHWQLETDELSSLRPTTPARVYGVLSGHFHIPPSHAVP